MAHVTSFVSSPCTSKSNQRSNNRRLIGNLPQKWHPDKIIDFPVLGSENFPALSSASLSNSDGLYGNNCEISLHYEKQSDISYSDKLQKNINNPTNSSWKLTATEGRYSYHHNENSSLMPNNSNNQLCGFKSKTVGVNKNSSVHYNSHNFFNNHTRSENRNASASGGYGTTFGNTKSLSKHNNLCSQNKSSKTPSNNSYVPHRIDPLTSGEQNRKFNIRPLGISNVDEKSFKNPNPYSSAVQSQLRTKETKWKGEKHKGGEHKRLSDSKNSVSDGNLQEFCTQINGRKSDTDFQAQKQKPHILRKTNMHQKYENERAKNKSTQSTNVSLRTRDNENQQFMQKRGMHIQEHFVSKNNLVKDSNASKLEQESKKKKKRKKISKIKRETLFQTGKLLILTPEFHSHLIHQLGDSKPNTSNNEIVDINNPNEYPSLNSPSFVPHHQLSMQISPKNQNRDEPVGRSNNCLSSSSNRSSINIERTADKCHEKINQVTWPSILEDKSQAFKTLSKDADSDRADYSDPITTTFIVEPEEEIEIYGKVKQCPRQPIQLFDILTTSKPKDKSKKKSVSPPQVTLLKKNKNGNVRGLNVLDSSSPNVKRGKEREIPKRKKITPLKKVILAERLKMKEKKLAKKSSNTLDSLSFEGDSKFIPSSEVALESSEVFEKEICTNFEHTFSELQLEFLRISENLQFKHLVSTNPEGIVHNFKVKDIISTARSVVNDCIKTAIEKIICTNTVNDIYKNSDFMEDNTKMLSVVQGPSEVDFHRNAVTNVNCSSCVTPFQSKSNVKALPTNRESNIEYFYHDKSQPVENLDNSSVSLNEKMNSGSSNVKQCDSLRCVDEVLVNGAKNALSNTASNDLPFCESGLCPDSKNLNDLKDAEVKQLSLLNCPEDKIEQAVETLIYSKTFRRYCNHFLSQELNEAVLLLIENLARFQDRQHQKDPVKARMKRRLLYGIKEVTKHLKLKKLKCIIIAPDMEDIKSEGGLNTMLNSLIQIATEYHIPCIFAADRKQLGKACHKSVPVSCVGVFSYEGSEVAFKKIIELYMINKKAYEDCKKIVNDNLTDFHIKEIMDAKEKTHDLRFIRTKILKSILCQVDVSSITNDDTSDAFTWCTTKFLLKL